MQRLSIVEENNTSESSTSSTNEVKERDFSMPAPPKKAVKAGTQPSMMRDKVRRSTVFKYRVCSQSLDRNIQQKKV